MIDRLWRTIAAALGFIIFGIGGLVLSFLIIPLINILLWVKPGEMREAREKLTQRYIQKSFSAFRQILSFLGVMDFYIQGDDLLRQDRSTVIVANHPSLLDYVTLASVLPQCDCIVKAAVWKNPFIRMIVKSAGYIPNRSPEELIQRANETLSNERNLMIFPEGTRTTPGELSKLQRGAAQIAIRTQSDVRFVSIKMQPDYLTKAGKWYHVPKVKPVLHIKVKEKIKIQAFIEGAESDSIAVRRLQKAIASRLFD